jgi:AAA ATPase-like protein
MSSNPIASPWTPYGLTDDPFFQAPLSPSAEAARPITLFVGRDAEIQLLGGQVVGTSSSRAIIEGAPGVGKTSFVNRLKVALAEQGVLTHEHPVRALPGMNARQFVAEVLRILLQIRATLLPLSMPERGKAAAARATSGKARAQDAFWIRVARLVEGEDSTAAGVTVGMLGAQRERVRIPAEVAGLSLDDELAKAVAYLAGDGERRVLIHVDNVENLARADAPAAAGVMQDARDALLVDGSHWLFVGATGIEERVFRLTPQVSGIIPHAVSIDPLSPKQVAELLRRRYQHLRRGMRFTAPVEPDVAAAIYQRYRGDLRNFLRLLSRAIQHHAITAPGKALALDDLVALMAPRYWAELVKRVGDSDAAHLAAVSVTITTSTPQLRPRAYARCPSPTSSRGALARAGSGTPGSQSENSEPRPTSLSTVRSPPINRANRREMARPNPVPPLVRVIPRSTW